jgi:hypothetical protein
LESGGEKELGDPVEEELKFVMTPSLDFEPLISSQEHRAMLQEANRRLLHQNLSNLL